VLSAQRRQNSAVPTYSENGAMFPNHGMGSPFCKPNEKYRTRVAKKPATRAGTGMQEAGDRPGDHWRVTRRFRSKGCVPRTLPGDGMVCGISYDFERIVGIASVQTIDPVVETKSEGAASTLESKSSTTRLVASEAIALPTTSVLRLNSTPLPAHRRCINLRKVSHPGNELSD